MALVVAHPAAKLVDRMTADATAHGRFIGALLGFVGD
jgi:hypothetical protein